MELQGSLALGSPLVPGVGQGFILTWPPLGTREGLLSPSSSIFFPPFFFFQNQNQRREELLCNRSHGGGKLCVALSSWKGLVVFSEHSSVPGFHIKDLL